MTADAPAPPRAPIDLMPERRLRSRRIPLFFAFLLYGFAAGAALIWIHFSRPSEFASLVRDEPVLPAVGVGVAVGLAMASASGVLTKHFRKAQELEMEFAEFCADHRWWEVIVLALLSGAAEELFFRGALTVQFGAVAATLAFAALHWPIHSRYAMWPVFALVAGAVFQAELYFLHSLWAPIASHAVVNAVNLWRIRLKYRYAE